MVNPFAPDRLPRNILSIVVAAGIACLGYVLFTLRFGEPLRNADQAMVEYREMERRMPETIDKAIERRLGTTLRVVQDDISDLKSRIAPQMAHPLEPRVRTLEGRIRELTAELERAEKQLVAASTNAANAVRMVNIVQQTLAQGGVAVSNVPGSATPVSPGEPVPVILAAPDPARIVLESLELEEPILVDRKGDITCVITDRKITSRGILIEFTLASENGDRAVWVRPPSDNGSASTNTKLYTSTGMVLRRGYAAAAGKDMTVRSVEATLIDGVPIAFSMLFTAKMTEAVKCPRIEIEVGRTKSKDDLLLFRFDDVTIEPE